MSRIAIIVHSKEEDGLRPDPSNVPHFNVDLYELPIFETIDMAIWPSAVTIRKALVIKIWKSVGIREGVCRYWAWAQE